MTTIDILQQESSIALSDVAAQVLDSARRNGATSADVDVSRGIGRDVGVRLGDVETLEQQRDRSVDVTVYVGQRKGSASSADFSKQAIESMVAQACAIARHGSEDPAAGLADADLMATAWPDLDLYHPWSIDVDASIDLALACESAGRGADERISNSNGATVATYAGETVYANSHGFSHHAMGTRHSVSCSLVAGADDSMQREHWYTVARAPTDMQDAEAVGREAARRTVARLAPKHIATGRYPVFFTPGMARGLVQSFISAISGGALYRRASFLLDSLGEEVFPGFFSLSEDPFIPRALSSAGVDSEGVARQSRKLVDQGVLTGWVLSSYSARKLGLTTTGNAGGVCNLTIEGEKHSFDALLATMQRGLVVTEMMGNGGNPVTGDYSRGAAGFWVENGEIVHPVEGVTVAGNLRDVFANIVAVGDDTCLSANLRNGSILVSELTVASSA
ncbi:MAG: metalloprotease PmbA [Pseudomonadota bacterium]